MAPEQISQGTYTNKVDIWGLGVILYQAAFKLKSLKVRSSIREFSCFRSQNEMKFIEFHFILTAKTRKFTKIDSSFTFCSIFWVLNRMKYYKRRSRISKILVFVFCAV